MKIDGWNTGCVQILTSFGSTDPISYIASIPGLMLGLFVPLAEDLVSTLVSLFLWLLLQPFLLSPVPLPDFSALA